MKVEKFFTWFLIVTLLLTLAYIGQNLGQKSLWYDEAGQFYISKGLNHDSEPFAKEAGLKQVIENNANYNLDPGGFSILLHFWTKVSNSHEWLRVLPFLFFLGFICSWIYLFNSWFRNLNIALLSAFIPLITRTAYINLGFEIRAYSMEYLGTLLCVIALILLKKKLSHTHLLIWSCVFAFFITSRYSEVMVVFVASLFIIYLIYLDETTLKQKIISFFIYATPLFLSLLYIILAAQIHQNKNMVELDYVFYLSRDLQKLTTIPNLLFASVLLALIGLLFFRNRYQFIKKYELILFFTVAVNLLFIILSVLGIYPWMPEDQRSISIYLLLNVCAVAIGIEVLLKVFKSVSKPIYYLAMVALIFALVLRKDSFGGRKYEEQKKGYYKALSTIDLKSYNKIFVESRFSSPSVRYLFEHGALKSRQKELGYPEKFTFGKYTPHHIIKGGETEDEYFARQLKMNDYLEYDLLLTPRLYSYGGNDKWKLLAGSKFFYVRK